MKRETRSYFQKKNSDFNFLFKLERYIFILLSIYIIKERLPVKTCSLQANLNKLENCI